MKIKKLHIIFPILLYFISIIPYTHSVDASVLYFEPQEGEFHEEEIFFVDVKLDTESENINLCEVNIKFPSEYFQALNVINGDSILSLWPQNPNSSVPGTISFIGGVPGGFSGNGKLLTVAFKTIKSGSATMSFGSNSKVLLNDGKGTPAELSTNTANFSILSGRSENTIDKLAELLSNDKNPPSDFELKISKIENDYFLIFSAKDIETGIDHYEIREGEYGWKTGNSPYLLENQNLRNKIQVKAIDRAGNERVSEIISKQLVVFCVIIFSLIILAVFGIWMIFRKFKRKK